MKFIKLLLFLFLISCNLNNIQELHGVSDLKLKINQIRINESNENDIIKIFGPPIIQDVLEKNIWSYYEIRNTTNYYGKKNVILHDVALFKFNKDGLLIYYELFDINSIKDIKFDNNETVSKSVDQSLLKSLLASSKKRLEMSKERLKSSSEQ